MAIVDINTVLDPPAKLAVKVKDTLRAMPPRPSDEIRMKHRWYQCTVQNATQFEIRLEDGRYFEAGQYLTVPQLIGPYGQMTFTTSNDRSGASTGLSFSANLDETHRYYFAIGLDAPYVGRLKAGVVQSNSAKTGLEIASREGNSITSENRYKGKDNDGDDQVIEIHLVAHPGMEMKVVIT
ncbi:polyketide synthase [Fusarium agapanthi]|uniref:Polyketide synthase n=1 Tax=Fusarium agapanthi TaxID=1803897 RepID=A0A9P5B6M4_9HYPO|nr:polyketide synthase [Fusarium agapanthi]